MHRINPWEEKPKSKYRPYKQRDRPTLRTQLKVKVEGTRAERRAKNSS